MQSDPKHELVDVFPEEHSLSNCFLSPVLYREIEFKSVEHAYQLFKFFKNGVGWTIPLNVRLQIIEAPTGPEAKRIAYEYKADMIITDTNEKVTLAYEIMREKFIQSSDLRKILLETDPNTLFEQSPGNTESDKFWGIGIDGAGENVIGNILMHIRKELLIHRI